MKIKTILTIIFLFSGLIGFTQYDYVIKSLNLSSTTSPKIIDGQFEKNSQVEGGLRIEYYDFTNSKYNICYFPKQPEINCGYFIINDQIINVDGEYPYNLGCDLDYGSFRLFEFSLGKKNYLILTCIRYGSGTTTRNVYCNLFDVTKPSKILFYPLWSIYGSNFCFGDYNNDYNLDFLEIRYDSTAKDNNIFRMVFTTLNGEIFNRIEDKFIVFRREYQDDSSPLIIPLENKW